MKLGGLVGTDLSRPLGLDSGDQDARKLPVGTDLSRPLGLDNRQQGRDKSVPTDVPSLSPHLYK